MTNFETKMQRLKAAQISQEIEGNPLTEGELKVFTAYLKGLITKEQLDAWITKVTKN